MDHCPLMQTVSDPRETLSVVGASSSWSRRKRYRQGGGREGGIERNGRGGGRRPVEFSVSSIFDNSEKCGASINYAVTY